MKKCSFSSHYRASLSVGTLALCLSAARPALAQAVYGSVVGSVIGSAGEPIKGAAITVISVEKASVERATSNSLGWFTITHLLSDTYNIRAEAPGYKTSEDLGEEVYADQAVTVQFHLDKGMGTGSARSREASSLLKTDRADVSTTLSLQELQDLPNFDRNFTNFELLAPGALPNAQISVLRPELNPQQGLQINQNGQHYSGSAFQLDGTDNNDPIAGIIVINPSLESLSEMKVTAQNFDAEFGQALAGLVTAQTRSGSNRWHGSAFEIRNTDWGAASDPNLNNPNLVVNPLHINQFGGSVGGPLVQNRLFVFGDYRGNRRVFDSSAFVPVPTQKVRDTCLNPSSTLCDLSDYNVIAPNFKTPSFNIYVPAGFNIPATCSTGLMDGSQFPGNMIPTCMLSTPAVNLLKLLPAPNSSISKSNANLVAVPSSYEVSGAEPWNDDEVDLRIDQNISERFKLFGRYTFADFRIDANGAYGAAAGGFGVSNDGFAGSSRSRNQDISGGFDYIFNPSLNMDFRFGFYRYHLEVFQGGLNTTPASEAGIPGLNLGDKFTSGMPSISINDPGQAGGIIAFGYGQTQICNGCPLLEHEQQFQGTTNWTRIKGEHNLKFGADFRYARNLRVAGERAGALSFSSLNTSNPNPVPGAPPAGLSLATFLLGDVTSFNRFIGSNYNAGERQNRLFFYGQDNWRATSRLTLTYGLRWEIYAPQSVNGKGNGGFLDLNTGMMDVAGLGNFNLQGNVKNSFTNLAPRVGFAYHMLPHTVVRAAYGRSFDLGFAGAVFGDTVTQNLPVVAQQQLPATSFGTTVFTLTDGPPPPSVPTVSASGQFMLPPGIASNVVTSRMRLPTIDAWNFTVQQELTPTMFLDLGYVANKGTHVFPDPPNTGTQSASYDLNEATVQGFLEPCSAGSLVPCSTAGSICSTTGSTKSKIFPEVCTTSTTSRQPYFSRFKWNQQIFYFGNNANDNYESLQVKLEKRFKQGLQFRAGYTWSKSLVYAQDYFAIDPKLNHGPANFDRKHAFVFSNLWELPIGKGKPLLNGAGGVLDRVIGGWALDTVTFWYSGLPFSPTYLNCAQDRDTGPCRPNLVGPVEITGNRRSYFTTSLTPLTPGTATVNADGTITAGPGQTVGPWQRPAPGTFGNAGYNFLRGPGLFNTDLALLKNISLTESSRLQFRVDVKNVFNKVNLGPPSPCVDCGPATITTLASGVTMRQFQFALKLQF